MKLTVLTLLIFCSQLISAAPQLPKEISFELLLQQSLKSSSLIKVKDVQIQSYKLELLRSSAKYNPQLNTSYSQSINQNSPTSALTKYDHKTFNMSFTKTTPTATTLKAGLVTTQTNTKTNPETNANSNQILLSVKQSLLKNSFGSANRSEKKSIEAKIESRTLLAKKEIETTTQQLLDKYYQTWAALKSKEYAKTNLAKERQRLKFYNKQYKRGFISQADYIQLQSSELNAQNELSSLEQQIKLNLIELDSITNLQLLRHYNSQKKFPPLKKETTKDVAIICLKGLTGLSSYEMDARQSQIKQSDLTITQLKNQERPDLYLEVSAKSIANQDKITDSIRESSTFSDPSYTFTIGFNHTFGKSRTSVDKYLAIQNKYIAAAQHEQEKLNIKTKWQSLCQTHNNYKIEKKRLMEISKLEKNRLQLLEEDFQRGKATIDSVLLANKSYNNILSKIVTHDAKIFKSAWMIRSLNGSLRPYIDASLASRKR